MIHVVVEVELAAGKRESFLEEFHKVVPLVLQEEGCVEYEPAIDAVTDIDAQHVCGPDTVVIIEKWESLQALKAHLVAPHMIDYRPKVKPFVQSSTLRILETA